MLTRHYLNALGMRQWLRSVATRRISTVTARSPEVGAEEETLDVTNMDTLLKSVRTRVDPVKRSFVPVRGGALWAEALAALHVPRSSADEGEPLSPARDEATLEPRYMHDSYCEFSLPFASQPEVLEKHINASGGIRTGLLMEHLDSLAGSIAYKHTLGPDVRALPANPGFYIVTASVDRLDMLAALYPVRDMKLSGQVIHTGRSSMEVAVRMEAIDPDGTEQTIMVGRFSMVCRDTRTHRAAPVNPLILTSPEDESLYHLGEAHRKKRQSRATQSLDRVPPTSDEAAALHSTYLDNLHLSEGVERVWMNDTRLEKTLLMFPQERNVHRNVFGGYLMRMAYELGFANATLFTRDRVGFLALDGISFANPVSIGSLLRLTSYVVHTSSSQDYPALIHVWVEADVIDPSTGKAQRTNDFRFTWCRDKGPPLTRTVVPNSYKEAMMWLKGKRALDLGAKIRSLRKGA